MESIQLKHQKPKNEKKLLHYMTKAIADYNMIQTGDRILVCLSGGKDSFTLLYLLNKIRITSNKKFEIFSYTLDQSHPGWVDSNMRAWLETHEIPYEIEKKNTYAIVLDKIPEGKSFCPLCSRLRRGNIYRYAAENGFNKVALGHHRDDMIETLLMSTLYSGVLRSMPPKLLSDDKRNIVIRPLAYCQEKDIATYATDLGFPLIPCNLCGSQENLKRQQMKNLIKELADENNKVPSNILSALGNLQPSQLMDHDHWNFRDLENQQITNGNTRSPTLDMTKDVSSKISDLPAQSSSGANQTLVGIPIKQAKKNQSN